MKTESINNDVNNTSGTTISRFYGYPEMLIDQFRELKSHCTDAELINCHYAGIICVISVTSYERAVKHLLWEYANISCIRYSNELSSELNRLNAKIKTGQLSRLLKKYFSQNTTQLFRKMLDNGPFIYHNNKKISGEQCESEYNNLIISRHAYVHAGTSHLTFDDACKNFENGKFIIECLQNTLSHVCTQNYCIPTTHNIVGKTTKRLFQFDFCLQKF